jgi:F-box/WD-40 domain protein MET30
MATHFYEDSRIVATGSLDCDIRLWNVDTCELVTVMKGHTGCVRGIQLDSSKLISCSMDRTIRIWCMKTFECVRVISGHTAGVVCLEFNGMILASGAVDGIIRVWDLARGCSFTLSGHSGQINKVKILPCKTQVLSGSSDNSLRLWDISSQSVLRVFNDHKGPVTSIVLFKHNHEKVREAVSASSDHTIKIWDLDTGKCTKTLFGHTETVTDICANSFRIVSSSQDSSVKVYFKLNIGF